ncbi:LysR substrate-binding domain-containing protein [Paraburkholderia phytofirmans]|uniref:LysR substrate-binding domain-containing protein n=1 Tax=Paraburkholderia phytofirmans TaxID=261302 RepID=UPI00389941C6
MRRRPTRSGGSPFVRRLFAEKVFPVCSPAYSSGRLLSPTDLSGCTLLTLEDAERNWMSWPSWFSLAHVELKNSHNKITCNRYSVLLGLAATRQGVALGWDNIIDPLLNDGTLVRASDVDASLGGAFFLT